MSGFTLIEVLVSVFIVVIALLAIIRIFPLGMNINVSSERTTVADNLAQNKIEEMISLPYSQLTVGTIESRHKVPDSSSIYERQTVISYLNGSLQPSATDQGIKKVVVTVYWPSAITGLTERSFTLSSIISQR